MQEKRQHVRRPFDAEIEVVVPGSASLAGRSRDISIGGMFILAGSAPAFATEVTVKLILPGLGATEVPGIVRWTMPDGFGVQFGLLGARQTHAIGAIVSGQAG